MGATGTDAVLLAVDVGNTHIVIGTYQGDRLERHWRLRTDHDRTADEYGVLLHGLFEAAGDPEPEVAGIVVSSVATHQEGKEAAIFKAVFWHSITLASLVGLLVMLYAYVWTGVVP